MKLTPDSKDYKLRLADRLADGSGVSVFGYTYDSPRLRAILKRNGGQLFVSVHVDLGDQTSILVEMPDGSVLLLKARTPRGRATGFRDHVADLKEEARKLAPRTPRGNASGLYPLRVRAKKAGTPD